MTVFGQLRNIEQTIQDKFHFKMKSFDLIQIQMRWLGILSWNNKNETTIQLCLNCVIFGFTLQFFHHRFGILHLLPTL